MFIVRAFRFTEVSVRNTVKVLCSKSANHVSTLGTILPATVNGSDQQKLTMLFLNTNTRFSLLCATNDIPLGSGWERKQINILHRCYKLNNKIYIKHTKIKTQRTSKWFPCQIWWDADGISFGTVLRILDSELLFYVIWRKLVCAQGYSFSVLNSESAFGAVIFVGPLWIGSIPPRIKRSHSCDRSKAPAIAKFYSPTTSSLFIAPAHFEIIVFNW